MKNSFMVKHFRKLQEFFMLGVCLLLYCLKIEIFVAINTEIKNYIYYI